MIYVKKTSPSGFPYIEAKSDDSDLVLYIPIDEANSDYQAYLSSIGENI